MPPKISIIIPIYNTPERYLRKCLSAVSGQTLGEIEIIIVDDCGTDPAAYNLAADLCRRDSRVKLLQTPANTGTAAEPRNIGIRAAAGEYIFFCDDDDYPDSNLCEVLYRTAVKHGGAGDVSGAGNSSGAGGADSVRGDCGVDMVVFDIRAAGGKADGDHWIPERIPFDRVFSRADTNGIISEYVGDLVWNKLFRREFLLLNDLYCFPTKSYDDRYLAWCSAITASRIVAIRDVLHTHVYRSVSRTATNSLTALKIDDAFAVYNAMLERFKPGRYDTIRYDIENSTVSSVMYDIMRERDFGEFKRLLIRIQQELLRDCVLAEAETPLMYYHNEWFKRDVLFMRDCTAEALWAAVNG
ncbi:hypothetical protein FACS1894133_3060 [Clostridia bacterium]|nr:hypothetical protein FACS1894133_3060 [Clostridia bacterium]